MGQQRCADRKKIETESNRDRIVDCKIESKSIEIDKAESKHDVTQSDYQ